MSAEPAIPASGGHDLTAAQLPAALGAQLAVAGGDEDRTESGPRALTWLRQLWEGGADHLPLLVVHDLGHLLLRGRGFRFSSGGQLQGWDERERAVRLAYEDRVLGAWSIDPSVRDAHVAVAGQPLELQDRAVAHAIHLALARPLAAGRTLPGGNPAHLRDLVPDRIVAGTDVDEAWRAWGLDLIEQVTAIAPAGRLLSIEDLWEIAHLAELPSESARLSLRELHGAVRCIGSLPSGDLLRVRQRSREVPIAETDADTYPTGGFDAVATRGSFENLVRTEIVYVGEGRVGPGGVDLFDVRFIESELLFYTRDDSPLLDAIQTLNVIIHRPAELRTKHAAHPAQTLVMVQALALAIQADLVRTFGPAGARTAVSWWTESPADLDVAAEEQGLLALTLAAEVAHGRVALQTVGGLDEVGARGRIVFSPRAKPSKVEGSWLRVDGERWQHGKAPVDPSAWPEVRALANRLLLEIVGGGPDDKGR